MDDVAMTEDSSPAPQEKVRKQPSDNEDQDDNEDNENPETRDPKKRRIEISTNEETSASVVVDRAVKQQEQTQSIALTEVGESSISIKVHDSALEDRNEEKQNIAISQINEANASQLLQVDVDAVAGAADALADPVPIHTEKEALSPLPSTHLETETVACAVDGSDVVVVLNNNEVSFVTEKPAVSILLSIAPAPADIAVFQEEPTEQERDNDHELKQLLGKDMLQWIRRRGIVRAASLVLLTAMILARLLQALHSVERIHPNIILPHHVQKASDIRLADITVRDVLTNPDGFHLALAPAFFGFYGYFGVLAAWEEHVDSELLQDESKLLSVAGASAGAMAAILIAAGVRPRRAADFCGTMTLSRYADPFGVLAVFKGDKFEQIMHDFLREEMPDHSLMMEDGAIPVAVSGFDLQTFQGKILRKGSMARAARASATFPFLFQPVSWTDSDSAEEYILIDGGVADTHGLHGLDRVQGEHYVINLIIGEPWNIATKMEDMLKHSLAADNSTKLVTLYIRNLPRCGPWAMSKGKVAVEAASRAMSAALDIPLYMGPQDNHFELHIDASTFWS
jgi:hypothetical protein